jgi:hypothetical protein
MSISPLPGVPHWPKIRPHNSKKVEFFGEKFQVKIFLESDSLKINYIFSNPHGDVLLKPKSPEKSLNYKAGRTFSPLEGFFHMSVREVLEKSRQHPSPPLFLKNYRNMESVDNIFLEFPS